MKKNLTSIIFFFVPYPVFAQGEVPNPIVYRNILDLVGGVASTVREIALFLAIIAIIVVGFKFVSASFSGNPDEVARARKTLLWVFIGTAIVVAVSVIAPAIVGFIKRL